MCNYKVLEDGVRALMEYIQKTEKQKKLFDETQILLQIDLFLPLFSDRARPYFLTLPHPIYKDADVCLFVPDRMKRRIRHRYLPSVKKIIEIGKLGTKYHQFEAKRKLLGSYDVFMCPYYLKDRLVPLLGKTFIQKRKFPTSIFKVRKANIIRALKQVALYLPKGNTGVLKVGTMSQTVKQVTDNILNVLPYVLYCYKRKWEDVECLRVRTPTSDLSIPIYRPVEFLEQKTPEEIVKEAEQLDKAFEKEQIKIKEEMQRHKEEREKEYFEKVEAKKKNWKKNQKTRRRKHNERQMEHKVRKLTELDSARLKTERRLLVEEVDRLNKLPD